MRFPGGHSHSMESRNALPGKCTGRADFKLRRFPSDFLTNRRVRKHLVIRLRTDEDAATWGLVALSPVQMRLGFDLLNVINHGNYDAVDNHVAAPNFGQFVRFWDRRDGVVIDFIGCDVPRVSLGAGRCSSLTHLSNSPKFGAISPGSSSATFL